jgi:hypothetical protein
MAIHWFSIAHRDTNGPLQPIGRAPLVFGSVRDSDPFNKNCSWFQPAAVLQ